MIEENREKSFHKDCEADSKRMIAENLGVELILNPRGKEITIRGLGAVSEERIGNLKRFFRFTRYPQEEDEREIVNWWKGEAGGRASKIRGRIQDRGGSWVFEFENDDEYRKAAGRLTDLISSIEGKTGGEMSLESE
jgi:hypothetical protein